MCNIFVWNWKFSSVSGFITVIVFIFHSKLYFSVLLAVSFSSLTEPQNDDVTVTVFF